MNILLSSDDADLAGMLKIWFNSKGHELDCINTLSFKTILQTPDKKDLVLIAPSSDDALDITMQINGAFPQNAIPTVFLGADPARARRSKGIFVAADAYCEMPFELSQLETAIESALALRNRQKQNGIILQLKIVIQSDMKNIEPCNGFFSSMFEKINTKRELMWDLQLIFEELAANSIEHGNKYDPRKIITIELMVTDSFTRIAIEDQGDGFDFKTQLAKTWDPNVQDRRGRGILLMSSIAQKISFEQGGRRAIVEFTGRPR